MVQHRSKSENKPDKYIFILRNTIPKILIRKQERLHDKLTEILMFPGEACSSFFFTREQFRLEWRPSNQIICSKQGQLMFD